MFIIGAIDWIRLVVLVLAEMLAGICAAAMCDALFNGGLHVSPSLKQGMSIAQAVCLEMILTAQLTFTIFMMAAEKHEGTFLAPIAIGLSGGFSQLIGQFPSVG